MMPGALWMNQQTRQVDDMDVGEEAIIRLEAHEKECLVRYQNIQDTLNKHHDRFGAHVPSPGWKYQYMLHVQ